MNVEEAPVRSFVAVPLPAALQTELLGVARRLAGEASRPEPGWSKLGWAKLGWAKLRWAKKAENLHVTMKFLGPATPARLGALTTELIQEVSARPAFTAAVRGIGAFPEPAHATVIWAGVEDATGALREVAASVDAAAARVGFTREDRPFRPHVTLGRCKRGVDVRPLLASWSGRRAPAPVGAPASDQVGVFTVDALHVYESRLGGDGSTYLLRGRAPFGAARAA